MIPQSIFNPKFLPQTLYKAVIICGKKACKSGYNAFIVGGSVRDILLGIKCKDIDVCFEPEKTQQITSIVIKNFYKKIAKLIHSVSFDYYADFFTAKLQLKSGEIIDLSITRKEVYRKPGALPEIIPATIRDDLFRRDFTINSIAICINPEKQGVIYDFFCGIKDLKEKKLRVLHRKSFIDDPTRILRGIRFSTRFNFS
ncbi:MAG: hypothetical protein AB1633_13520, partial [Elusimicrobiota bacterium]